MNDVTRSTYQRIYAMVDSIPRGAVATYGQIAREAGLPGRARQVGRALSELPPGSRLPWHRVINASGQLSPRSPRLAGQTPPTAGERNQLRRLSKEGVEVNTRGHIDLRRFQWTPSW